MKIFSKKPLTEEQIDKKASDIVERISFYERYFPKSVKDHNLALKIISKMDKSLYYEYPYIFAPELFNDALFMEKAMASNRLGTGFLSLMSPNLKNNKEFAKKIVSMRGSYLSLFSDELLCDEEIFKLAVLSNDPCRPTAPSVDLLLLVLNSGKFDHYNQSWYEIIRDLFVHLERNKIEISPSEIQQIIDAFKNAQLRAIASLVEPTEENLNKIQNYKDATKTTIYYLETKIRKIEFQKELIENFDSSKQKIVEEIRSF